ncbi:MAG: TolC family protein [Cyclobacteriaceae bacterium]
MRKFFLFLIFLTAICQAFGQQALNYPDFMEWVSNYHPISRQADLNLELGKQELRMARGGFDPYIYGSLDEKTFKETEYYNKRTGGISLPTMAGVELKGLVEQNRGTYLNSENNVPENGLIALGASVNLGQGLFIDQRRAALRQAQIYASSTEEERRQTLNNLYLEATRTYWNWAGAYADLQVREEGLRLAEVRFEGIKSSFEFGDLPAIDTIEAYTQVLNRLIQLQQAENRLFARIQDLNVYLWDEDQSPFFLQAGIIPEDLREVFVDQPDIDLLRDLVADHPSLRLLDYDLDYLEIERRWKEEQLKPVVKVNYNFLNETFNQMQPSGFLENNYKFGIQVSTSLFLRKERGALGLTKAKINMVGYDRDLMLQDLRTNLELEFNNFNQLNRQLSTFGNNISGLERLVEGERIKFDLGESSLFLINARETSLFDALLIRNDINVKRNISYSKVRTAAGLGFDEF